MCGCNSGNALNRMSPVKVRDIMSTGSRLPNYRGREDDIVFGIATTPTGDNLYYTSLGGHFSTDFLGYQVSGDVSYNNNVISLRASASKNGTEVASFSIDIDVGSDGLNKSRNVRVSNVYSDGTIKPQSELGDCLARHGGDPALCCVFGYCNEECIAAAAAAVAACCLINPHC